MKRSLTMLPPAFGSKVAIFSHLRITCSHLHFVKKNFISRDATRYDDTLNFASDKL